MNVLHATDCVSIEENTSRTNSLGLVGKMAEVTRKIVGAVQQAFPVTVTFHTEWVTPSLDSCVFPEYNRSRVGESALIETSRVVEEDGVLVHEESTHIAEQEEGGLSEEGASSKPSREDLSADDRLLHEDDLSVSREEDCLQDGETSFALPREDLSADLLSAKKEHKRKGKKAEKSNRDEKLKKNKHKNGKKCSGYCKKKHRGKKK